MPPVLTSKVILLVLSGASSNYTSSTSIPVGVFFFFNLCFQLCFLRPRPNAPKTSLQLRCDREGQRRTEGGELVAVGQVWVGHKLQYEVVCVFVG